MSLAFAFFCLIPMIMCVIGFWMSFFELREYGVKEGLKPAHSIAIMGPALRDVAHPARAASIQFIVSLLGLFIFGFGGLVINYSHSGMGLKQQDHQTPTPLDRR